MVKKRGYIKEKAIKHTKLLVLLLLKIPLIIVALVIATYIPTLFLGGLGFIIALPLALVLYLVFVIHTLKLLKL